MTVTAKYYLEEYKLYTYQTEEGIGWLYLQLAVIATALNIMILCLRIFLHVQTIVSLLKPTKSINVVDCGLSP